MSDGAAYVRIGGVLIRLSSRDPLAPGSFSAEYGNFRLETAADLEPDVCVELSALGPAPEVCDAGIDCGTWAYHRSGDARRLVWHGDRRDAPLWSAEYVPGSSRVAVWCGPRLVRERNGARSVVNPFRYPLDQLLLMLILSERGGLILHSAGLVRDGFTVVAAGVSGAGKSTLSRLWAARYGGGSLLSDDRVIVRLDGSDRPGVGPMAYGTPWPGELGASRAAGAPIAALVLLRQAPENELIRLSPREAVERVLPQASVPWFDSELMPRALGLAERLTGRLPAYELRFTPDEGAVDILESLVARA